MHAPPLAPGCPWSSFAPPTMKFCEENLCRVITAPANTWSNLGFIFVGLYLVARARKDGAGPSRWIGPTALAVGLTSFAYHASYTFVLQVADRAGMVLFISLLVVLNLARMGWRARGLAGSYLALNAGALGLDVGFHRVLPEIGLVAFASQIALALWLEWKLRGATPNAPYRYLALTGVAFAVGWTFWWLDVTGTWCDPTNHVFQGHAVWHLVDASCFYFVYRFYRAVEPAQ